MKHLLVGCLALCFVLTHLSAQEVRRISVYFDTDQHLLNEEANTALASFCKDLEWLEASDYSLEILAHTDDQGTEGYNDVLAERRARSVWTYFSNKGIAIEKTSIQSFGELQPAFTNEDEEGRQGNRRVDILYTCFVPSNLNDLFSRWQGEQLQRYEIDAEKNTRLIAAQGTNFWIESGAFTYPDGTPVTAGQISLSIKEAYTLEDMIKADLTTQSDGKLLETGGMIYLEAQANGQTLQIDPNNDIKIAMPAEVRQESMQLFLPTQDAEGRVTDWTPTQQDAEMDLEAYLNLPPRPKPPVLDYVPVYVQKESWSDNNPPQEPEKPFKPIAPHQPKRESIKYYPNFFQRIFLSDETILAREEAMYQERLESYKDSYAKYEKRKEAYDEAWPKYEQAIADYKKDYAHWEKNRHHQRIAYKDPIAVAENEKRRAQFDAKRDSFRLVMDAWKTIRNQRLQEFEDSYAVAGNTKLSNKAFNQYVFSVNQVGWINCDRFYNLAADEKQLLVVEDSDDSPEKVFLIFEDINSMIRLNKNGTYYTSQQIPKSANVKIIGLKLTDGQPQLAIHHTRVDAKMSYALNYEVSTLSQVREALAGM